jgi:probable F420-dependent oxidoreductase
VNEAGGRPAAIQVGLTFAADYLHELPRVEELGYDSVWTSEHILFYGPTVDATVTLGAFAALTRRVTIGTAILLLPLRHPTITAKAIATADIISGGRVILGVGVGGEFPKEFEATGVPVQERGARANDAIRVLKKLWSQDHVSHHSRFVNFDDVTMLPKPPQPGGPPIVVAGRSEAAQRRAARLGDGYMPYLFTPERYAQAKQAIEAEAARQGRDLAGFHWTLYQFVSVADSYEEARERAVASLSRRYNQDFSGIAERYCALGTPDHVVERLRAFAAAGARHFILSPITPPNAYMAHLAWYAREVVPALKAG